MGALMRGFDWTTTSLGPPAGWPQSLKTAVSLMLRARQPVFIGWGPDLVSFYNDGYIPICGSKHPGALGRPMAQVWHEIWDQLSPINDAVMRGEPQWFENMAFDLAGRAAPGPSYFSFSYTPLLDDAGRVGGIFCSAVETTSAVRLVQQATEAQAAQRTLLEREEQLRLATDAAEIGMWDVDVVNGTMYWTPRVRAMFGVKDERTVSMQDFYAGLHAEDLAATAAAFAAACDPQQRALYDVEYRTVGLDDGRLRWVAAKGRGLFDESGQCVRVLGTAIDITERKATEQAMEVALAASRTGTFHWDIRNNRLTWDAALDRLFGLRPGEVVRSLDQFISLVHPDDRAEVIARCERCRDFADDFEMEFRVVYPDGSIHWLYDRGRTFVDADGRARTMTGACVDVTERKLVETALRASERELRAIADNSPDVISRFDRELRFVFVNAAIEDLSGFPAARFLGRTIAEMGLPPERAERWNGELRQVFADGQPRTLYGSRETDGVMRHLSSRLVPETGEDGRVEHVLAVTRDVTDLLRAQEALQRADRQKDDFLATLAHELRNPLAPLRTGLHVLKRGGSAEETAKVRAIMERQLDHMVRLVDELLDIARISQGKIALRKEVVPLHTVLEQAVEACRPLLDAQGHTLVWEGTDARWQLQGDATRLVQVLGNLLNNASKYTPRGGRVTLRAVQDGDLVRVDVEDTGIGIPPEDLDRVFDRFVQVEQHLDRAQGGLGIGLSLVKSLVEMHGGRVAAASEGPGRGSRFSLWLPLVQQLPVAADVPAQPKPIPVARRKVLIVDDNRDAAETLAMLVELGGHEVHLAHDGMAALEAAVRHDPSVVFLDIGMPGMNGYETAGKLRALPGWDGRTLVALTGWGSEEDRSRSLHAGFDLHLTKPVEVSMVESVLAGIRGRPVS